MNRGSFGVIGKAFICVQNVEGTNSARFIEDASEGQFV